MSTSFVNPYDLSAGVFVRGLSNLKSQLTKAEAHGASVLEARLGPAGHPRDLHGYTLAQQVHWAGEGARLAVARLLGSQAAPDANVPKTFAELHARLDATIAALTETLRAELEAGLERTIEMPLPAGTVRSSGAQFLLGYAIPHFHFHLTAAYAILRNQGVALTMSDFLGNWSQT